MPCNVGGVERSIRIGLGLILLGVGIFAGLPTVVTAIAYAVGAVALVTGAIGYCPAWTLLGLNTCPAKQAEKR